MSDGSAATAPPTAPPPAPTSGSAGQAATLAAVSGYVDGVGASVVAGVFVSFMSGNTTSTGIGLGTLQWAQVAHVGVVIPFYVVGIVAGGYLVRRGPRSRVVVLAIADLLLVGFLIWGLLGGDAVRAELGPGEILTLALLALPMGLVNTTLRTVGPSSVGLGYVTGTLVSFGEGVAALLARDGTGSGRSTALYGILWLAFFLGAAAGAAFTQAISVTAVVLPIVVLATFLVLPSWRGRGGDPTGR